MKRSQQIGLAVLACASLALCGCATLDEDINDHFGYRFRTHGTIHRAGWAELHSRAGSRDWVLVWPFILDTQSVHVTNDLAVFVGIKPTKLDSRALFAARAGNLACDISHEALRKWAAETGGSYAEASELTEAFRVYLNRTRLDVHIVRKDFQPSGVVTLGWDQISTLIDKVEKNGKTHEVATSGYWAGVRYKQLEE